MSRRASNERGAALLMTLILVAALSAVAVAMSDGLSIATRRAANAEARDQALWHLLGAEQLARQILRRDAEASPDRTTLDAPWAQGAVVFPTDAGRIEGLISDASNCFNLNSLVIADDRGRYVARPEGRQELAALAAALELSQGDAERFAGAAADWIDGDTSPSSRGAEDFEYSGLQPPYRTANTLFVEPEEARALAGAEAGLFEGLRPYLCAYPEAAPAVLNVNTLRPEQAPLLTAALGGVLTVEAAEDVIAGRPAGGWVDLEDFWATPALAEIVVDEAARARAALTSRYFELHARVHHGGSYVEGESLVSRTGANVRVVRRRLGGGE